MARAAEKLSDAVVRKLKAPATGNRIMYDSEVKGFGCRITAAGAKAFVLNYRIAGKERRLTIGSWPDWTVSTARDEAKRLKRDVDRGTDPLAEREAARPAADGLFKTRAEAFLELGRRKRGLPLRPATKKEYKRALLTYATDLHGKPLAEISRGEIAKVIQRVARDRGEVSAMRCRAAMSRLYSWAIANGHADVNPVTGTEGYVTPKRSRVLGDAELRAIWGATAEPADFHLIVRLMLWTGTRRSEPGGIADTELDGPQWTIPGARTKNGRVLALPLPRQAVDALAAWPRVRGRDLLFGRGRNGFQGWSDAKGRLDDRIARANADCRLGRPLEENEEPASQDTLPDWDLHDVRRTVETRMAGLGIPKEIVNRVLNHAAGPITETYDLHSYRAEKAAALQAWADALERIVGGADKPGKVVPLRRADRPGPEVGPLHQGAAR
jgi:integrase